MTATTMTAPVPAVPDAVRASASPAVRTTPQRVGAIVSVCGVLVLGFFVYTLYGSALPQHRAQEVLLRRFRGELAAAADAASRTTSSGPSGLIGGGSTTPTTTATSVETAPARPALGAPVALLSIPSIHLLQVVVEGTTITQLRNGPGHHRNTVLPGQPGNAAISAPRTANGAPFEDLDHLRVGDHIEVITLQGRFEYDVASRATLRAGSPDPTAPSTQNVLTLITSTPKYLALHPLVVTATLRGLPVAAPPGTYVSDSSAAENGFNADPRAWALTLLALQLVVLVFLGARWAYRNWRPVAAWVVSAPVLLAALIILFQQAAGLLPATF